MREKKVVLLAILAVFIILVLYLIQKQTLQIDTEQIKEFIRSFGILGPIVLVVLITTTIIISPLASLPFWFASLALFGFWLTCLFIIISNSIGSAVNFLIAQRFGRPIVAKLVGKKGVEKIDEITEIIGSKMLFIARLFGGASADYVSYAAGLTSMKFRPYLLISIFVAIPMIFLNVYLLDKILALNPIYIVFLAPLGYALALVFPLVVYKWPKKKLKKS